MHEIRLASTIITDIDRHVLLLHRRDHNQWQLPGGRAQPDEAAAGAAIRKTREKLGIDITDIHRIGSTIFGQGEAFYDCEWFQVTAYDGITTVTEPLLYDDICYANLLARRTGRLTLSPNVENLVTAIHNDFVSLER